MSISGNTTRDERHEPRLVCEERLFEIKFPVIVREPVENLRLATEADLLPVAEAHAEIAFLESGVNPLEKDRSGYLERVARRINQNRVWVVFDGDTLVFQTQIVAETNDVMYLEGVYVIAEYRGRGTGANCLSQLSRTLLEKVDYVCMLSNVQDSQNPSSDVKSNVSSLYSYLHGNSYPQSHSHSYSNALPQSNSRATP